jgi:hypothetical protein
MVAARLVSIASNRDTKLRNAQQFDASDVANLATFVAIARMSRAVVVKPGDTQSTSVPPTFGVVTYAMKLVMFGASAQLPLRKELLLISHQSRTPTDRRMQSPKTRYFAA